MQAQDRLYQELARKLIDELAAGKYKVGDRLPAERAAMRTHLSSVLDSLLFATEEKAIEEARKAAAAKRNRYAHSA